MKIVIAGTGEYVEFLADTLSNENLDVVVVAKDAEGLAQINARCNVLTHVGDPKHWKTLHDLHLKDCRMFVSLLHQDSDNLLACSLAKEMGVQLTVARITDNAYAAPEALDHLRRIGVDRIINYEYLAALQILSFLRHPWARMWESLFEGRLIVASLKVEENSPTVGTALKDFEQENRAFHVAVIKRGAHTIIPRGDDVIQAEDILYFTGSPEGIVNFAILNGLDDRNVRRVVMLGGSEIAVRVTNLPDAKKFSFKLIEKDEAKARALKEEWPDLTIIHGDGSKAATLEYAGGADLFVSLSKVDEVNILSCVTAQQMGIANVLALVDDLQNMSLAEYFSLNGVVNRKLLVAAYIFGLLLGMEAPVSKVISLTDAEIMAITANPGSKITEKRVRDLKLPPELTLAGVIHNGQGELVDGNTRIEAGDQVAVVCRKGFMTKVKKWFN